MIISEDILARIAIAVLAFAGYLVARHIHREKKAARPLVCPVLFDCDTVVHSDYSKFFGVPVEIFGMIYYLLTALSYIIISFLPEVLPNIFVEFMVLASISAFIFSVYLICIQIFVLKKGCSWCFVSALICILIFVLTLLAYDFSSLFGVMLR